VKTAVIIPNYNGAKFMNSCMSALEKQTYGDFCVLVVDNGSMDGSAILLSEYERQGKAKVICLPENTGFSGAVNTGIRAALAMEEKPEYIVLLNNDTEAESGYLEKMAEVMEADTGHRIGAVSPLMINLHDPSLIDSAGDGYCLVGWAFQRGVGRKVSLKKFSEQTEVFSACAGAAMYRTEALEKIAFCEKTGERWFFDPAHFAYLEDVDVSFRLRTCGYRILFEPASRILHFGSGTSGSRYNDFKVRLAARNNVWLNWKNMPFLMLLVNLPFILAGLLVKQLFFVLRGFGSSYFKGFCEGIKGIPAIHAHKVKFRLSRTGSYLKTEGKMILDLFSYLQDLFCRHVTDR